MITITNKFNDFVNSFVKENKEFNITTLSVDSCIMQTKNYAILINRIRQLSSASISVEVRLNARIYGLKSSFSIKRIFTNKDSFGTIGNWLKESYDTLKKYGVADEL